MNNAIDHQAVDAALGRCGSSLNASQAHGLCCSRLAVLGQDGMESWLRQVLEGTDPQDPLCREGLELLRGLHSETHRQLAERQSGFTPLLPDEQESATVRAAAMAQWCEGFLHGLVTRIDSERLKKRLASDPLKDIIRDLLEITRAAADPDADDEANERAYADLLEYLRVTTQLVYEELAGFRRPAGNGAGRH
ncbi:MAG: UPF0149 family protein [Woeseiaceae bacterium]